LDIAITIINSLLGLIKTKHYYSWLGYDLNTYYMANPGIIVFIRSILWIPLAVLAIIGIINALNGKYKELPLLDKVPLFKD